MKTKILLIATIIALSLMSVTVFAADTVQVGTACEAEAAICCSGNKSTIAHLGTAVWNSTFVQTFEMKINGSATGLSDEMIQAWLQINNTSGVLYNFSMTNVTSNWTYAITGMNARTGGNYWWNVFANNSTGDIMKCMGTDLRLNLTRGTVTSTLTAYNRDGQSITSYTAPNDVKVDCVQTHSTFSTETVLPSSSLAMTLTYPSGWTGSTSNPASYTENSFITLTPIGAGNSVYTFTCTYTADENYSTGTDGTLAFTVKPGGDVIIIPGTQPPEQPGFFSDIGGIWTMLNTPVIAGIPLWIVLLIAIGIYIATRKKKFKF